MGLVEELLEAQVKLAKVICDIMNEFEGSNGLIEEMKSYELKKNIAKTTGTVIGIAGVCLIPFTFGWSLAATATGAGVNLITEFVDSTESHAFRERIKKHMDAYQEHCEAHENLIKRLESNINELSSAQELDVQTALLYCALSAETDKLDKKMVKISDAEMVNRSAHMAGLALTLQQTGKSAFMATVKGVGKATVVVGSFVSAYETVTLFMDWNGTHPTIAGAEKVIEELKKALSSLNKRMANIKRGVGLKSNKQGNGDKSQYDQIWKEGPTDAEREDDANATSTGGRDEKGSQKSTKDEEAEEKRNETESNDVNATSAGGGDERGPPKKNEKADEKRNETQVIVESDTIFADGRRILKISAVVRPENLGQGTNTNNSVAKNWKRNLNVPSDYHAGHIIGCMLGGSGSNVNNLVLMHSGFNNGCLKSFEFRVRNLLKYCQSINPGASVEARITVSIVFAPGGQIPYHILYGVRLVVDGVVEKHGYAAVFEITCCAKGSHDGPCDGIIEDYYYTDE